MGKYFQKALSTLLRIYGKNSPGFAKKKLFGETLISIDKFGFPFFVDLYCLASRDTVLEVDRLTRPLCLFDMW